MSSHAQDLSLAGGPLGPSGARRLTDEAKSDAEALWTKLVRLYEGEAHSALGYPSWGDYFEAEFGQSSRRGYHLLSAGRVLDAIEPMVQQEDGRPPLNERQARELAPLLDEPEDALQEVAEALWKRHGGKLTAEKTREAVTERLGAKREQQARVLVPFLDGPTVALVERIRKQAAKAERAAAASRWTEAVSAARNCADAAGELAQSLEERAHA